MWHSFPSTQAILNHLLIFRLSLTLLLILQDVLTQSDPSHPPQYVLNDAQFDDHLTIDTTSGIFSGFTTHLSSPNPVNVWLGIPYAKTPIGSLRFRAPIPLIIKLNRSRSSDQLASPRRAWSFGNACPQTLSDEIPVPMSEDCLSLNLYRPSRPPQASLKPKPAQDHLALPVLVWIHGGGLSYGASSQYDGSTIVSHSHEIGKPIVLITINYRLNSLGFLNSDSIPVDDLSVGLKDQIAALEWIQVNVQAFGGDPRKVTIWGQSAGGFSVSLHMTYLSQSQNLFRAAIMDSGAPTSHTVPPVGVYDLPDLPYNLLLRFTGCDQAFINLTSQDGLECLRRLSISSLMNATDQISRYGPYRRQVSIWGPGWKLGSLIDKRPSKRLQAGEFLHLPLLTGTNQDEGTVFAIGAALDPNSQKLSSDEFLFEYISNSSILNHQVVRSKVYQTISQLYPNLPHLGSPFKTGNQTFDLPKDFKRLAAWFGDLHYQAPRRFWTSKTSERQNTFVYLFTGPRNTSDPEYRGVPHSSEIALIFGRGWYQDLQEEEKLLSFGLARKMRSYYINFVYDLNPGPDWPVYTPTNRKVMKLDKYQSEIIEDDWRLDQIDYLNSQPALDTFDT